MARYALTICLSAFLLFLVQPLIARFILPWFGGTPAVWTTCMLFFQVTLVIGYSYAFVLDRYLRLKHQAFVHISLLVVAIVFLPIIPNDEWRPVGNEQPAIQIVRLLFATIGFPYFLLATTGPLLQAWFRHSFPNRSPYRLFALSNLGSLAALVSYPFLIEPFLPLGVQAWIWSAGYILFAIGSSVCAWRVYLAISNMPADASQSSKDEKQQTSSESNSRQVPTDESSSRPSLYDAALWLVLTIFPSVLLIASTSQLSQEVAVVPFLWVLPLTIYLISFIICFDNPRWYVRPLFAPLSIFINVVAALALAKGVEIEVWLQLLIFVGALFVNCMCCHGELAKIKPNANYLTLYYLCISIGGALGGVFCAMVAPVVFNDYFEMHIGIGGCFAFSVIAFLRHKDWIFTTMFPSWVTSPAAGSVVGSMLVLLFVAAQEKQPGVIDKQRGFFGILTIRATRDLDNRITLRLRNGRIKHGIQILDPEHRLARTSYYSEQSGIGHAIRYCHRTKGPETPIHLGVIGLGTGSMAAYGRPGDRIRFYEINPDVIDIALKQFQYIAANPAATSIVLGDARIQLEREADLGDFQAFDILAVDAFTSDSIPMHLLTKECIEVYKQHLKPDGILAIHISNRFLDLAPVVYHLGIEGGFSSPLSFNFEPIPYPRANDFAYQDAGLGEYEIGLRFGYHKPMFEDWYPNLLFPIYSPPYDDSSEWIILTNNESFLRDRLIRRSSVQLNESHRQVHWTDDFGSIWQIMRPMNWNQDVGKLFDFESSD